MKVGVNILNFGPGAAPADLAHWAQVAEALGYHSIWISDHIAVTPDIGGRYPEPYYDPFVTLAWLASQTKRVQIGTTVIVLPYRNAVLNARLAANIDMLSGGRFIFGVGVGGWRDEFEALGIPIKQRGRIGDETLEAMHALWNADSLVSYHGRHVNFDNVQPITTHQKPRPPIWVGGWADAAIRRAVLYGDGWHPIGRPDFSIADGVATMKRIAADEGKPEPAFMPRIRLDLRPTEVDGNRLLGVGSIEQIREDLAMLQGLGAQHVVLDWYTGDLEATRNHTHGFEMLSRLAADVLDLESEGLK